MLVKDFTYQLPDELIARYPAAERDGSRLMALDRSCGKISENIFSEFHSYLQPGDLLIMNDTRVIPARLFGVKESGGRVELFLLKKMAGDNVVWEALLRGSKRFKEGQKIILESGMFAEVIGRGDDESWLIQFSGVEVFDSWLEKVGHIPLPPYFQREDETLDRERYQTVVASVPGAVAAPTAGLHFTHNLIDALKSKGVNIATVTLHTGLGTFKPVRVERVEDHRIHCEKYIIPEETVSVISSTKKAGGRLIAIGTTSARALEYVADDSGKILPGAGEADIFIYPGYRFKVVDALLTNFHLPESTLLMLISAFAGKEFALSAYQEAVRRKFRFYSYGDAMFIF